MPSRKITKEEQKATEQLSKERLKRIMSTRRHHLRTNARVLKYGTKSFVRNTWLSVAAIAIMAITLLVLSATVIATHVMSNAIDKVEQQVDMSIYIEQNTSRAQIDRIVGRLAQLPTVLSVSSTSPEEALSETVNNIINRTKGMSDEEKAIYRQNLMEAPNKLSWEVNVKLVNLNNTTELEEFVANDESIKDVIDKNKTPSYASDRRDTINNIANTMNRIEIIGLVAAAIFMVIAILVVFNTIRMAIFNRKEEIRMMLLVGASRWFIVGPFVVEAALYGVVAAIIAGGVTYSSVFAIRSYFGSTLDPTLDIMKQYWYFVACALLIAGIVIGIISALLATRKYLKQH